MQARRGVRRALEGALLLALAPVAWAHVGADAPHGIAALLRHLATAGDHLALLLGAGVAGVVGLRLCRPRDARGPQKRR